MVKNDDILCHLGKLLMSLSTDEKPSSDLLLVLNYGSHVCVKINPESLTYLNLKDTQENDILSLIFLLDN